MGLLPIPLRRAALHKFGNILSKQISAGHQISRRAFHPLKVILPPSVALLDRPARILTLLPLGLSPRERDKRSDHAEHFIRRPDLGSAQVPAGIRSQRYLNIGHAD